MTNIYPDVGVGSHASQAKEDRPKDCTDAKWWYKKAKRRRNKFWTFCELKNGRGNVQKAEVSLYMEMPQVNITAENMNVSCKHVNFN